MKPILKYVNFYIEYVEIYVVQEFVPTNEPEVVGERTIKTLNSARLWRTNVLHRLQK